jgi:nitroimidazol reductase NimA-like FMN-containing flavoprotein (pyridoxamine 5'-phosphate oxidase superfamily)
VRGTPTLLNRLSGLDEIDGGQVLVERHDLFAKSDADRTRHPATRRRPHGGLRGPSALVRHRPWKDDHDVEPVPSRPSEQELDHRTCLMLLNMKSVGRLVLSGDEPFVIPVNFVVVDDLVVFRCDPSSHAAHSVGTAAAFEVDSVDVGHEAGWSVIARGILQDVTGRLGAEEKLQQLQPWAPGDKSQWLALHLGELSGRWVEGALRPAAEQNDRGYL